jgi:predicted double-glycine peptidase
MTEIYLVCYYRYDSLNVVFATESHHKAKTYRAKFNRLLEKWTAYYEQFVDESGWINFNKHPAKFCNWCRLKEAGQCFIQIIEVR